MTPDGERVDVDNRIPLFEEDDTIQRVWPNLVGTSKMRMQKESGDRNVNLPPCLR